MVIVHKKQRGVALIMVLIILALVTIVATQLIAERGLHARRTSNQILADNAWDYALGAETLARIGLVELFKNVDEVHLNQPWAQQGIVYPIDENGNNITGTLKDLRSCFNLNALAQGATINNEQAQQEPLEDKALPGERLFAELLTDLQLETELPPEALAARLRDWVDDDQRPAGFEGREDYEYTGYSLPYRTADNLMVSLSELNTISGFTPKLVEAIKPYICAIPGVTELTLNVNTIEVEQAALLSSLYDKLDLSTAVSILSARPQNGYDQEGFNAQLPAEAQLHPGASVDFTSPYFQLKATVALGRARVAIQSLLEYDASAKKVSVLARLGIND
jgi:general secretion pathway protein K